METCQHCGKELSDYARMYNHIYGAHGKTKAKRFKAARIEYQAPDTEAEWIISGMIGER